MTETGISRHEAVRILLGRQKWFVDQRNEAGLRDIYARDARLTIAVNGTPQVDVKGRDAVIAFTTRGWKSSDAPPIIHLIGSVLVEDNGDGRMRANSYQVYIGREPGNHAITGYGEYFDLYVLEDGAWRLQSRDVKITSAGISFAAPGR